MDILLVDGYNVIGAWPELRAKKDTDLASAREILIDKMAEYKAYTGFRVIIVFDAHLVKGIEKKLTKHQVDVIYTRENETADERIEKLAKELINRRTRIHVATSDFTEQTTIFSQGALRKSARELLTEMREIERNISKNVQKSVEKKPRSTIPLSDDIAKTFEKWRRGER
ncbi:hypothetical protein EJF36_00580 [Bacillus sp. HMF5848]|uniref:NYN domain-containing protein n=1 Tax=Bacillus sp. HMF5848 TaxID=2495421 RepID=UPI000F76FCF0|nr:NYN domain-containing protein [Bacillus sp. HMF5848]RSK25529.1 hypothetical protein EJF36_00580 [Bacillus sp. HMF5848]